MPTPREKYVVAGTGYPPPAQNATGNMVTAPEFQPNESGVATGQERRTLGSRFDELMRTLQQQKDLKDYPINAYYPGGPSFTSTKPLDAEMHKRFLEHLDFQDLMEKQPKPLDFSRLLQ